MAAALAAAGFVVLPWAFVDDDRSGLSQLLAGRWPLILPLMAALLVAATAGRPAFTGRMRVAAAAAGLEARDHAGEGGCSRPGRWILVDAC